MRWLWHACISVYVHRTMYMYDCVACLRWTFPRCLQCITKGQFRLWRWTDRSTQGHTTLKALCALEAWLEELQTKAKRKTVDC